MTKEQLAEMLNGRQYGNEMSKGEANSAEAHGLVVVFGYSDDCVELRGAIEDEYGASNGRKIPITRNGVLYISEEEAEVLEKFGVLKAAEAAQIEITAWWGVGEYSLTYTAEFPHATFDILEDGQKFCRGIVFSLADIGK